MRSYLVASLDISGDSRLHSYEMVAADFLWHQKLRAVLRGQLTGFRQERRLFVLAGLGWRRRPAFDGDANPREELFLPGRASVSFRLESSGGTGAGGGLAFGLSLIALLLSLVVRV